MMRVGWGTSKSIPSGALTDTGCEYPSASSRSRPRSWARYPTPWISSRFSKPSVTPWTMFATSVRVRPCRARCSPRSVGRVTRSSSSTCTILMSRGTLSVSSALGPFTVTRPGSIEIDTPDGTGIGCFPIRDMARSPDLRHDLATDALAPRVVTGHHPLGRRDDRRSHPPLDPRDVGMVDVCPAAGPRNALEAGDHRRPLARVLQSHPQLPAGITGRGRDLLEGLDVSLLGEDARELSLHTRVGNVDVVMLRRGGIAQPRQEVRDGVGHRHRLPTRFGHPGHISVVRQLAQADPAEPKLAVHGACPAAATATGVPACLELGGPPLADDL